MTFPEKLRQYRMKNYLSMVAMAKLCGISYPTYHSYEKGYGKPSYINAKRIAEATGIKYYND